MVNHGVRLAAVSDEHAYRYSLDIGQRALPLSPDIGNGFFPMTETRPARSGALSPVPARGAIEIARDEDSNCDSSSSSSLIRNSPRVLASSVEASFRLRVSRRKRALNSATN